MGTKNIWVIGRDTECDIVINSKNVSRKQAEILQKENVFFIVNHSTHNTSFLKRGDEKIRVDRTKLQEGDLLFFADEGPFDFESLVDTDRTIIDLNPLTQEKSFGGTTVETEFHKYIEKKRCKACASIIAKQEKQCSECGSLS